MYTSRSYFTLNLITYFIAFLYIILISSCNKDPLDACAEDPTCEYFRCKVNGEWWTPDCEDGSLFGCRHTDVQYYRDLNGGGLSMTSSSKKNNDGFVFRLWNIKEINTFNSYKRNNKIDTQYFNNNNDLNFFVDTTKQNEFILTHLDTISFIISARFSFIGIDENGQTVSITDGEFRQNYRF
jgi:hypothetical protein